MDFVLTYTNEDLPFFSDDGQAQTNQNAKIITYFEAKSLEMNLSFAMNQT